jgi:acyl-CoA synthetase (AMP-forming)/AMP-acid ligase II
MSSVARWGGQPGLISCQQGIRWDYRELGERVDVFAAGLLALSLKPGERVGIWSPNNAEWVVTQFATAKAGLILVNINPAYRLSEVEYALNKVGCRALVTATRFKTSDYIGMVNWRRNSFALARGTLTPPSSPRCAHRDPDRRVGAGHDPVRSRLRHGRRRTDAAGRAGGGTSV